MNGMNHRSRQLMSAVTILWAFLVLQLIAAVCGVENRVFLNYLPSNDEPHRRVVDSPTIRLRESFKAELHFNSSCIRRLENVFLFLDSLYHHHQQNDQPRPMCKPLSTVYTTAFVGSGFFSHFQSYVKSMLAGLHHTNFSAPVIPMGSIVGYTTTTNCDFAQRSFYCYFQHLSPCQGNWSSSMVPLSPSVYRYRAFDRTMIPKDFQQHGEAFWWGALQYYVFMHMHGGIVDKYITNDALRDLTLRTKGNRRRHSSSTRGISLSSLTPRHDQGAGRRNLEAATVPSASTFVANMNRFDQRRHAGGPISRRDAPPNPRSSSAPGSSEWTRTPNGNTVKTNGTTVHSKVHPPKVRPQRHPPASATDDDTNEDETLPYVRRSPSTLTAAWLPRIGVHVRAIYEDPKLPTQMMLTPTNAALRTQAATLADIDEQVRSSSLCPLHVAFESSRYVQCFTPIQWPSSAAGLTPHTLDHWRFYQRLRAAVQGTTPLVYRQHINTYGRMLLIAGKTMGSWLRHGESVKRTINTRDVYDLYHSGAFVARETIDRFVSMYHRACGYSADGSRPNQQQMAQECNFTAEDEALVKQEMAARGGWVMPVDVFLASDDAALLVAVEKRYHWVTFPLGLSQDGLYDRPTDRFFTHVGHRMRSSSYKSYFSMMPVQASLEVLRDVYYLTHACSVLIGSASSQVFRAAVSMGGAIGRVTEVRWLEGSGAALGQWKERADRITMPFPELS